jgi:hypothetical protein
MIELFIEKAATLPSVFISPIVSVMIYNIFSLERIAQWWRAMSRKYEAKLKKEVDFTLSVMEPAYLSPSVLSGNTRANLSRLYQSLNEEIYTHVIQLLEQPYAGNALHNDFVIFTKNMDKYRHTNIVEVVPELAQEIESGILPVTEKQIPPLIEGLTGIIESGMTEAMFYFKRGLLKREAGDNDGAFIDLEQAVHIDSSLYHLVPEHWWG